MTHTGGRSIAFEGKVLLDGWKINLVKLAKNDEGGEGKGGKNEEDGEKNKLIQYQSKPPLKL